jgi:twitching motility protein PilT
LHTSGAASTVNRIIDAFPTDQQQQIGVQLANNLIAVLSQTLCPRIDTEGVVAAYEFMYVTPGIQNLIREGKSFRIDSEIQTGKKFGMELLDDNLWRHYQAGRISPEETIDKSKNPGMMVDRFHRNGIMVDKKEDDFPEPDEDTGGPPATPKAPAGGGGTAQQSEAEKQAAIAANRARMMAAMGKKS